ncbi:MAG: hypothetical protein KIT80_20980 [Chitinophagaceae bacterium]|nr:hypothetical protein [Chitinophagaceae bacterium]MCW5929408.1 hypothetical protein [Chitinophagaceae bacterium]
MKFKLFYVWLTVFVLAGVFFSCSKASEDEFETAPCNTDNIKYVADILPIVTTNCYACHSDGTETNGISLEGYQKLKIQVDNGKFLGVVSHAAGYTPMPYSAPKLSNCDINKIKAWIEAGAPDN